MPALLGATELQLRVRRPAHVGDPAGSFEQTDQRGGGIELAPQRAVPRGRGMRVVEVVPGLAHREDPERCEVAALVLLRRRLLPEHVADRVDAPCHVVQQHHAEQPGPEQRGEGPTDCAGEGPAEEEGGSAEHGLSHHAHGASEEIEYPLTPVEPDAKGDGTSTTVVNNVTLEGLLSGDPKHVNVHKPGSGEPPPVTCANLNEAL